MKQILTYPFYTIYTDNGDELRRTHRTFFIASSNRPRNGGGGGRRTDAPGCRQDP